MKSVNKILSERVYLLLSWISFILAFSGAFLIVIYTENFNNSIILVKIGLFLEGCFLLTLLPSIYLYIKLKKYKQDIKRNFSSDMGFLIFIKRLLIFFGILLLIGIILGIFLGS